MGLLMNGLYLPPKTTLANRDRGAIELFSIPWSYDMGCTIQAISSAKQFSNLFIVCHSGGMPYLMFAQACKMHTM